VRPTVVDREGPPVAGATGTAGEDQLPSSVAAMVTS
jgi:hypothetical protein